jgi:hypothetical protein
VRKIQCLKDEFIDNNQVSTVHLLVEKKKIQRNIEGQACALNLFTKLLARDIRLASFKSQADFVI